MESVDRTIRYMFILAFLLILVAYWAGANKVLGALFGGVNMLDLTVTGRTASGQFAAYPTGGPAA